MLDGSVRRSQSDFSLAHGWSCTSSIGISVADRTARHLGSSGAGDEGSFLTNGGLAPAWRTGKAQPAGLRKLSSFASTRYLRSALMEKSEVKSLASVRSGRPERWQPRFHVCLPVAHHGRRARNSLLLDAIHSRRSAGQHARRALWPASCLRGRPSARATFARLRTTADVSQEDAEVGVLSHCGQCDGV